MHSTIPAISPLRQRFLDDMRMRKLSLKTQSGYLCTVSRFYGAAHRSGALRMGLAWKIVHN